MNDDSKSRVVKAEERLREAMLQSDAAVLDELIAPELVFTNHVGQLVTKQADLAIHRSGTLKLQKMTPLEDHLQMHEGFAVVSVLMHLVGSYETAPIDLNIRYTRVWIIPPGGSPRIVAGHAGIFPMNLNPA